MQLIVNGQSHEVDVDSDTPLLWVLRDTLGLVGTKFGCGAGQCGACTVHVDGAPIRACAAPLDAVAGRQITTIEGLAQDGILHKVQKAWIDHDVPQCGYCQSGMIMCAEAKRREGAPGNEIVNEMQNLCVCGTYQRIRKALGTVK